MTAANPLTARLMEVLGCKKEISIPHRMKHIGMLVNCGRCGGCGEYSYCSMHGSTCFGCSGRGLVMPKLTEKVVAEVAAKWTPEVAAAYSAELARIASIRKSVQAVRGLYSKEGSKVIAKLHELATAAGIRNFWEDRLKFEKEHHPELCEKQGKLYDISRRMDKVIQPINPTNGKMLVNKKWVEPNWQEFADKLAPLWEEWNATDVV